MTSYTPSPLSDLTDTLRIKPNPNPNPNPNPKIKLLQPANYHFPNGECPSAFDFGRFFHVLDLADTLKGSTPTLTLKLVEDG